MHSTKRYRLQKTIKSGFSVLLFSSFLIAVILCGCNSSHSSQLEIKGSVIMSATNGADIYLLHEMDGALLGMGVRTAHSNPTYIPIQLTSQPIFPRTSVLVQYSEKAQAIWLECKSGAFFAHIYYSFKDRKCIDGRYGRMINAGHEPGWVSPEYRTDTIPETPDDIKVVLKLEVGSGTGGL